MATKSRRAKNSAAWRRVSVVGFVALAIVLTVLLMNPWLGVPKATLLAWLGIPVILIVVWLATTFAVLDALSRQDFAISDQSFRPPRVPWSRLRKLALDVPFREIRWFHVVATREGKQFVNLLLHDGTLIELSEPEASTDDLARFAAAAERTGVLIERLSLDASLDRLFPGRLEDLSTVPVQGPPAVGRISEDEAHYKRRRDRPRIVGWGLTITSVGSFSLAIALLSMIAQDPSDVDSRVLATLFVVGLFSSTFAWAILRWRNTILRFEMDEEGFVPPYRPEAWKNTDRRKALWPEVQESVIQRWGHIRVATVILKDGSSVGLDTRSGVSPAAFDHLALRAPSRTVDMDRVRTALDTPRTRHRPGHPVVHQDFGPAFPIVGVAVSVGALMFLVGFDGVATCRGTAAAQMLFGGLFIIFGFSLGLMKHVGRRMMIGLGVGAVVIVGIATTAFYLGC